MNKADTRCIVKTGSSRSLRYMLEGRDVLVNFDVLVQFYKSLRKANVE